MLELGAFSLERTQRRHRDASWPALGKAGLDVRHAGTAQPSIFVAQFAGCVSNDSL